MCSTKKRDVRSIFEQLFRRHGVPKAIQCDNGVPFVSVRARAGLSSLSAWWVSLGIHLVRSRPGCPQDNGGHERMHSDVRADVQAKPAANRQEQQRVIDRWRQEFNRVRPHQALSGKTPAEVYKGGERRSISVKNYPYPKHFYVRRIATKGLLSFRGDQCPVGLSFAGLSLGVEVVDASHVRLWLRDIDLGLLETMPAVDDTCFLAPARRTREKHANRPPVGGLATGVSASPSLAESR